MRKKINELYISKEITLLVPFRRKTRRINYIVTGVFGTEMRIVLKLKSKSYPCQVPNLASIEMELKNEFPTKRQVAQMKIK